VQSRPVGSSDRLDAGAHGWNIADCHTLLGPEETAAPVLFYEGPAVVFFSAGSLSDRIPGSWNRLVRISRLGGEPVGV
jgi:hypothetical protein